MCLNFKDYNYSQFEDISLSKQLENDNSEKAPKNSHLESMARVAQKYNVVQEIDDVKL